MDLDCYLRENGISGSEFAAMIGVSEASLSRIRRGDQNITRETIRQIVAATSGAVTAEALVFGHHGLDDTGAAAGVATGQTGDLSGGMREGVRP